MKSHSNSLAVAAVTALVLCLAPMAGAQSGSSTTGSSSSNTDQANRSSNWNSNDQSSSTRSDRSMHASMRDAQKQHSAHKLMGRAVNGSNGEKLGDISDFVIDSQSGRIAYAVVSSGGVLGIGDTLRLVPAAALTPGVENTSASAGSMNASMSSDKFTVNVDKAKFDSAPKFKKDQIASLSDRRSEIDQYYGQTSDSGNTQWDRSNKKSSQQNDMSAQSTKGSQFVLASDVIGKEIRSGNDKVGKIDDLVIDWNAHRASILLDPDRDFVRTDRTTTATGDTRTTTTVDTNRERGNGKYVVSFDKVMISGTNRDAVTTTLTRDQFTAANSATGSITGAIAGSSGVYAWTGWNDTSDWQASANLGSGSVTANSSGVNYSSNTASSSKDTSRNVSAFGRDSDVAGPGAGSIGTSPGGTTTDTGGATIAGNTNGRSVEMSRGNENMPNTTTSSTSMASSQAPVDSVRQALNDSSLPSEAHQVQVSEQNGKLVLKGTVPSQNIKDTIEDKVEEAANGWDVDNQISVAEKD
jgi:sporulation protein YlmC with PRC-barrel domain